MINDLNSKLAGFTEKYENKVLEKASPDETIEKYKNSRALTQKIADALLESHNLMSSYASLQNFMIVNVRTKYDLLIQQGETLELLMKINRATEAIKPEMILSQVDEVVTYLKYEMWNNRVHGAYILEKLKKNETIYGDILLKLIQNNYYEFWENFGYFISDCTLPNKKEIALAMINHPKGTATLVEHMDKFSFAEEERKEIAFAMAVHEDGAAYLAESIGQFSLSDEDLRMIVSLLANHSLGQLALFKNIEEFSFLTEEDRKEIALIIARNEGDADFLYERLSDLSIKNEQYLKEIAMAMANHDDGAEYVAHLIHEGEISYTKETDRKEIAFAISKNPHGAEALIKYYKSFKITDKNFVREAVHLAFRWPSSIKALKRHLSESEALKTDTSLDAIRQCPTRPDFDEISDVNEKKKVMIRPLVLSGVSLESVDERIKPLNQKFPGDSNLETIKNYYSLDPNGRPSLKDYRAACTFFFNKTKGQKELKQLAKLCRELKDEGAFWAPIYDCVEGIVKIDGDLQYELTHWMNYSLFQLLETRKKDETGPPFESQLLKKIYNIRDRDLRYHLASLFAEQMSRTDWQEIIKPPNAALAKILLNDLKKSHPEIDTDRLTQTLGKRAGIFKDGEKAKILYNALWGLKKSDRVNADTINAIFDHLSRSEKKSLPEGGETKSLVLDDTTFLLELKALNALVGLKKESSITFDSSDINKEQLIKNLSQVFDEPMPGLVISDSTRFSEYFFGDRQPGALAIYVAGLLKLSPSDSEALLRTVKTFIEEVDADTFQSSRYQKSETLDRIAETSPEVLEKWKKEKSGALADYLRADVGQDIARQIIESIRTKIVIDNHLPLDKLPKVAELYDKKIDQSESFDHLDTLLSNLIQEPDLLTIDYLETILEALRELPKDHAGEFINDVVSFKEGLKPTVPKELETWSIVDSDDPLDLFLSGTEVGGSCQSVDDQPQLNKALMGYVMDGKHRILAVKDSRGQILERFILRLLIDKETNKPVLFFERIYPATAKYKSALLNFAKERAGELGVPLVSQETVTERKYGKRLVSYASKAPYEYCDALDGIQTGKFELKDCYQIAP